MSVAFAKVVVVVSGDDNHYRCVASGISMDGVGVVAGGVSVERRVVTGVRGDRQVTSVVSSDRHLMPDVNNDRMGNNNGG